MSNPLKLLACCFLFLTASACGETASDNSEYEQETPTRQDPIVEEESESLAAISGVYESASSEEGMSSGTVVVNYLQDGTFEFEITTATQGGCTGDLMGEATIAEDKTSSFSSDMCNLTFEFRDQALTIEESECEAHGMQCGFAGTYEKQL